MSARVREGSSSASPPGLHCCQVLHFCQSASSSASPSYLFHHSTRPPVHQSARLSVSQATSPPVFHSASHLLTHHLQAVSHRFGFMDSSDSVNLPSLTTTHTGP